MMKEITVLDCENVKKFKFARLARSHIRRFLSILVSCQYNDVYIAPYHKQGRRSVFSDGEGGGGQKLKGQNLQYKIFCAKRTAKTKIFNVY